MTVDLSASSSNVAELQTVCSSLPQTPSAQHQPATDATGLLPLAVRSHIGKNVESIRQREQAARMCACLFGILSHSLPDAGHRLE